MKVRKALLCCMNILRQACRLLPPSPKTWHPPRVEAAPRWPARCSCCLHSSQPLGKAPGLAPFSNHLGCFFAQVQESIASLGEAGLSLKTHIVTTAKRRLHRRRAKPEGALRSQLPASTTWSTARRHRQSKARGVWQRPGGWAYCWRVAGLQLRLLINL